MLVLFIFFNKVRDDEIVELETLARKYCHVECAASAVNVDGKVNILLQTYLARGRAKGFSLISDLVYISQVKFKVYINMYITSVIIIHIRQICLYIFL